MPNQLPSAHPTSPLILIIEDDPLLSKMYSEKFKHEGFPVIIARDGEEALLKVSENMPDFILLDMMLPKYSGHELLTRLRHDEIGKKVPIIALTNLASKSDAQKALALGAKEYLVKAMYSPEEVVNKVKQYLPQ